MARVTPVLWTQKKNKKGLSPIYLRIEANNERGYLSLRTRIRESQWNDNTKRVRKSNNNHEAINNLITQRLAEAEAEMLRLQTDHLPINVKAIKDVLEWEANQESENFLAYADSVIEDFQRRGKLYTYKRYKSIIGKLRKFTGESLRFDQLTPRLFRDFETHLIEHYGNNTNTIAANFNAIRAILYKAIKEGYFSQSDNPFFHFKVKGGKTSRAKLTPAEVDQIVNLELDQGTLISHVRNYFLFSFYCAGIRFGDLAKLTWSSIQVEDGQRRLVYRMSKTGTQKSIKLIPQAAEILDNYVPQEKKTKDDFVFPILTGYDVSTSAKLLNAISSQNALINKYLKKIASQTGIECKLSFHVSRHSFADYARKKGMGVYNISKALGHSSIKVTENYLKGFDAESLDTEMDNLFGS